AQAPSNPSVMYAYGSNVAKSIDGGLTWNTTPLTSSINPQKILVHPATPSTLFAIGFFNGPLLLLSTDSGTSWTAIGSGLAGVSYFSDLLIEPSQSNSLYLLAGGGAHSIFKSIDGGSTWLPADTGLTVSIDSLALDPHNPATLYASSQGAVFK